MKKLLALVLSCIFVLLLASCGEELPASDYVKKGKIMVDNTIPFVIDDSVAIDAKEAEAALIVGAHYSSFAAKFGYKTLHYTGNPYRFCYTVYPLNDGRLLYLVLKYTDNKAYVIQESSVIADKNTNVEYTFEWDAPYVLMNISDEVRLSEYQNGIENGSLLYETYMRLEQKLDLSVAAFAPKKEWDALVRIIKWENGMADVFELTLFLKTETAMLKKTTYELSDNTSVVIESNEKSISFVEGVDYLKLVRKHNSSVSSKATLSSILDANKEHVVDDSVYTEIDSLDKIEKGIFVKTCGGIMYNEEMLTFYRDFNYSYSTADGVLYDCLIALDGLMKEQVTK